MKVAGMGLAISRSLIEAHGVHYYELSYTGARLTFTLPAKVR